MSGLTNHPLVAKAEEVADEVISLELSVFLLRLLTDEGANLKANVVTCSLILSTGT